MKKIFHLLVFFSLLWLSGCNQQSLQIPQHALVTQYETAGCNTLGLFDSEGAVMVDYGGELGLQYNPVTISQYALGCYHQHLQGCSECRTVFLNQIKYLRTKYKTISEDMVGYPFDFAWSYGLEPGWYSGMAQGQAISALIRYYYLTDDKTILPLVKKTKNFMVLPTSQGGPLTHTPEGHVWIEEFPSAKPSLVLNGFISAVFGLYEYISLFPEDSQAIKLYQECIESLKASISSYDNGSWTYLDLHDSPYPQANHEYMMAHYIQTRTLYNMTKDPFFRHVELRWQSFFHDVNIYSQGNNLKDAQDYFYTPLIRPIYLPSKNLIRLEDINNYASTPPIPGYDVPTLLDNKISTYFGPITELPSYVGFNLKQSVLANTLPLTLFNVELYPEKLLILAKSEDDQGWQELPYTLTAKRQYFSYRFADTQIKEFAIVCQICREQERLVISELALGYGPEGNLVLPEYGSFLSEVMEITSPKFEVRVDTFDIESDDVVVIYRYADSIEALAQQGWEFDFINPTQANSLEAQGKYYQFKIIYKNKNENSKWTNFRILPR
ncbi:MAG: hypothetical protein HS126_30435 [Anaerolineales bacterium]|nr:hypothetical protein [Anaerolineales bacterium]